MTITEHDSIAGDLHARALACAAVGDYATAIECMEAAIASDPADPEIHVDCGRLRYAAGDAAGGASALARACDLASDDGVLLKVAAVLSEAGEPWAALHVLSRVREGSAHRATALTEAGYIWLAVGDWTSAAQAFMESKRLDPSSHRTAEGLAYAWTRLRRHGLALQERRAALALRPRSIAAAEAAAWAAITCGERKLALAMCRELIDRNIIGIRLHSAYLSTLLHDDGQTTAALRVAHEQWAAQHIEPLRKNLRATRQPVPNPSCRQRLRIGYIGGEFWTSPGHHFVEPLLRHHNRDQFHITIYDKSEHRDEGTGEYEALADAFRSLQTLGDDEAARQIRDDRIDILVDVSGHYQGHILPIFVRRPAPVQMAYPTYPCTTGLAEIEHIITDPWVSPEGATCQYSERVCHMNGGYITYRPPAYAPEVAPQPAQRNDLVTFGIFQRPAKFTPPVWNAVAEILHQVPRSRLLIHFSSAELEISSSALSRSVHRELESRDIDTTRLELRGVLGHAEHLALVSQADICLDTFPYNGQTTTCESLWMGVPVVTLTGDHHVARVGWELLDRAGLGHFAAKDPAGYVNTACELARDLKALSALRSTLRSKLRKSPLLQHRTATQELESIYRRVWRDHCAGLYQ